MRTLILAGNYQQYKRSKYYPDSRYINMLEELYGYSDTLLIRIGTWYQKWNYEDIARIEIYCSSSNIKMVGELE